MGDRKYFGTGVLAGRAYGSWQLYTRGSDWRLVGADGFQLATACADREISEPALEAIVDRRVAIGAVQYPTLELILQFDNGCRLKVGCSEESECDPEVPADTLVPDEDEPELACWELYTGDGTLLDVWTGGRWRTRTDPRMGRE
jgi:hypothetical protein